MRMSNCGEDIPQIDCSEPVVDPVVEPVVEEEQCYERDLTTEAGCRAEAEERGYSTDVNNGDSGDQTFAGAWEANGCFVYVSSYYDGYYDGRAYFGTGGSAEEKLADFCIDDIHQRMSNCGVDIP
jgi:hypothetical protein